MSRIAIVSLTIAPGDAVGNDALEMQRVLAARGHEVGLFSSHWVQASTLTRDVREAGDFLGDDPAAILVYHHATGWDAGLDLFRRAKCRRVVRYHNVTPGRFFAGHPGSAISTCTKGREQLAELAAAGCELYLSASAYNEAEVRSLGADPARCAVVPPFHQVDRLAAAEPDPEVLRACRDGHSNFLFVGRRVPNKGHRFLIDAFAAYVENYDTAARLLLIGREAPGLAGYSNQLRDQARRLGVHDRVLFLGAVTEAQLRAYYECAHAFVVASEHEGFCVPVVEAMALGVPVVAYGTSAVPDTVGEAGLVWDEPEPFLLAESMACMVREPDARAVLVERGRRRYREHFANERIAVRFLTALEAACRSFSPLPRVQGRGEKGARPPEAQAYRSTGRV
jgi:glycosyltransferase involved in cell wall biosynthesis